MCRHEHLLKPRFYTTTMLDQRSKKVCPVPRTKPAVYKIYVLVVIKLLLLHKPPLLLQALGDHVILY